MPVHHFSYSLHLLLFVLQVELCPSLLSRYAEVLILNSSGCELIWKQVWGRNSISWGHTGVALVLNAA